MSLLHGSFHLVFCLPLRLFPVTGASNILPTMCRSSLLLYIYHFSLFSVIFFVTCATFTDPLTHSFLVISFFVTSTHPPQHPHLIHIQSPITNTESIIPHATPSLNSFIVITDTRIPIENYCLHLHWATFKNDVFVSIDIQPTKSLRYSSRMNVLRRARVGAVSFAMAQCSFAFATLLGNHILICRDYIISHFGILPPRHRQQSS